MHSSGGRPNIQSFAAANSLLLSNYLTFFKKYRITFTTIIPYPATQFGIIHQLIGQFLGFSVTEATRFDVMKVFIEL